MKSKLSFLTKTSLNRKIKSKWFIAANILIALAIIGLMNMDYVIKFFGGDFDQKQIIYVLDKTEPTNNTFDTFAAMLIESDKKLNALEESKYDIKKYDGTLEEAKKEIEKDNSLWVITIESDKENYIKSAVISNGKIDTMPYQLVYSTLTTLKTNIALIESNISPEKLEQIYAPINVERVILDEEIKSEDESMEMIMSIAFPLLILPFFMLTIFLIQMIGAEVNDEKTTRGMEIIISSVSPEAHFFSKVLAGNLFVLIQGGLLILYSAAGFLVRAMLSKGGDITNGLGESIGGFLETLSKSGIGNQLVYAILLTLALMILTFIAYSLLAGILASMTTNIEDFQQLQTPIIIISLVGYYLAMLAGLFKGSIIIKIISFIPFISAILSPSLFIVGQIGIIEVLISIVIMIVTIFLLIKYGLKIYKVGILNYSSKDLWKKMFKAMKN